MEFSFFQPSQGGRATVLNFVTNLLACYMTVD